MHPVTQQEALPDKLFPKFPFGCVTASSVKAVGTCCPSSEVALQIPGRVEWGIARSGELLGFPNNLQSLQA